MKYRKKPVVIEAHRLTFENLEFLWDWCKSYDGHDDDPEMNELEPYLEFYIKTLEGRMTANLGDYIIKGVNGEFYPCKPDIFEKTYEKVED